MYKEFFRRQLGGSIQVDRVNSFISTECHHPRHPGVNSGIDYIAAAQNIRFDGFHGVILTGWHLFERRRVDDHIHPFKSAAAALQVANIADEVTQCWMVETGDLHLMLFQFISAEDN